VVCRHVLTVAARALQVILAAEESVQTAVEAAIRFVPPTRARYCVQQLLPLMTPDNAEAFVQSMRDKSHEGATATASASSSGALTESAVLEPRAEQWAQLAVKGQFTRLQVRREAKRLSSRRVRAKTSAGLDPVAV